MQKKKSGVKKCLEILPLRGGGRLMANAILNFHFDFPHPSLRIPAHYDEENFQAANRRILHIEQEVLKKEGENI